MIVCHIEQLAQQVATTPAMQRALEFLKSVPAEGLPDGRVDLDGDTVYAIVQSYNSVVPSGPILFEAHRQFLDVQYVQSGEEVIAWAPVDQVQVTQPYGGGIDALLGHVAEDNITRVKLTPGYLAVLWPTDAHAPRVAVAEAVPVKKIVVKVAVGQ